MVSSSGLSCRSSPRISAPICLLSATTSSRAFVIATIDDIEAEADGGRNSERRRVTRRPHVGRAVPGGQRIRSRSGEEILVRAAPADGFAPHFGLACLRSALHATQVAHYGEREVAHASGAFHSVYEAPEQISHAQPDHAPRDQYRHQCDPTHEPTPF